MARDRTKHHQRARYLAYGLSAAIFLSVLVLAETISWQILRAQHEKTYPLFFNPAPPRQGQLAPYRPKLQLLDPQLSHAHTVEFLHERLPEFAVLPGFVAYGDPEDRAALRIVALGGSTTDPSFGKAWPYFLQQKLNAAGLHAVVFNGGVGGYSSNQEFFKLVRDVLPLEPDLVISLSGINDVGFLTSADHHPMVHRYQQQVFETITGDPQPLRIFPNTSALAQVLMRPQHEGVLGVSFGPDVDTTPGRQWERNVRLMHAVCEASGVEYICFRQPVLGIGAYSPTPEEKAMLENYNYTVIRDGRALTYYDLLRAFYDETAGAPRRLPYCIDFVDVFKNKPEVYRDARHQNAAGCQTLANAIFTELQRRDLLKKGEGGPAPNEN